MDGHIPRNMRIVMSMLDLAAPYVNVYHAELSEKSLDIKWKVGGSTKVNSSELFYTYIHKDKVDEFVKKLDGKFTKTDANLLTLNKEKLK